jgi:hypothetical protein
MVQPAAPRSGYIASPRYDALFFILPPVFALALVEIVARLPSAFERVPVLGVSVTPLGLFIGAWTSAHLFAVVFRSHANPEIFAQHRGRFVAVPLLLFAGFVASDWLIVSGIVLAAFWDVYHTSAQNFGFCRIYDSRLGNDPQQGRWLDFWLCHFIYIAPIFFGLSLAPTLQALNRYLDLGWRLPGELAAWVGAAQPRLAPLIAASGAAFLVGYAVAYRRLVRGGYRISPQKIAFLAPLAVVTLYAWWWLPAWKAYFVVNFYHALQYFAIVWWSERRNVRRVFGLTRLRRNEDLALIAFVATVGLVGISQELWGRDYRSLRACAALFTVIALMHFWYDGFVWSVRRRQVA